MGAVFDPHFRLVDRPPAGSYYGLVAFFYGIFSEARADGPFLYDFYGGGERACPEHYREVVRLLDREIPRDLGPA